MKWFGLGKSLKNSVDGLKVLLRERAFKQELILGVAVLAVIFFSNTKLYVFSSYCLVLIAEALNTGVENAIDRISADYHYISKKAKDVSSFAVLIAIIHLIIVMIVSIIS